MQSKFDCSVRQ